MIASDTMNGDTAKKWALNNGPIIIADTDDNLTKNCDIKINGKHDDAIGSGGGGDSAHASTVTSSNGIANHTNQPLHSLSHSNKLNNNKSDEINNHLSQKIRERIDSETRNIEEFIDKTVTGIVELKADLMRVSGDELNAMNLDGMRKRATNSNGFGQTHGCIDGKEGVDTFLRKEINMAVSNQVNVLPVVLSNGHGD